MKHSKSQTTGLWNLKSYNLKVGVHQKVLKKHPCRTLPVGLLEIDPDVCITCLKPPGTEFWFTIVFEETAPQFEVGENHCRRSQNPKPDPNTFFSRMWILLYP